MCFIRNITQYNAVQFNTTENYNNSTIININTFMLIKADFVAELLYWIELYCTDASDSPYIYTRFLEWDGLIPGTQQEILSAQNRPH